MDRRHSVPNYLRSSRIVGIPSILFTLIALFSAVIPSRAQGPGPCDWPSTCSLWTTSVVPGTPAAADSDAVNLGVKFRTAVNGYVTGIRFYKGATNTGTHIVSLWSANGLLLRQATAAELIGRPKPRWAGAQNDPA